MSLNHALPLLPANKSFKTKTLFPNTLLLNKQSHNKILPIPFVYVSLPNSPKFRSKLRVHGHKYFSKVVVCNKESKSVLENIQKSSTIKYIKTFEFDPYFCEDSCMKSLRRTLPKLRASRNIDLILRRVSYKNETEVLCSALYRILRMKKLRMEFPGTLGIEEKGFSNIAKALAKCNSLKSMGFKFVDVPITKQSEFLFAECLRKTPQIEELTAYFSTGKDVIKDDLPFEALAKYYHNPKLKRLILRFGISRRWSLNTAYGDASLQYYQRGITQFQSLEEFSLQIRNLLCEPEEIFYAIQPLPKLRTLAFSLLNCGWELPVIMSLALAVSKVPQLETFFFKFLQKGITSESLVPFLKLIYRCKNLKKVNILFGRFKSLEPVKENLEEELPGIGQINRVYSKEYVHLSW